MLTFLALYYNNAVVKPVGNEKPLIQNTAGYYFIQFLNYNTLLSKSIIQLDNGLSEW